MSVQHTQARAQIDTHTTTNDSRYTYPRTPTDTSTCPFSKSPGTRLHATDTEFRVLLTTCLSNTRRHAHKYIRTQPQTKLSLVKRLDELKLSLTKRLDELLSSSNRLINDNLSSSNRLINDNFVFAHIYCRKVRPDFQDSHSPYKHTCLYLHTYIAVRCAQTLKTVIPYINTRVCICTHISP